MPSPIIVCKNSDQKVGFFFFINYHFFIEFLGKLTCIYFI
jgi:hypothetical protein